MNVVNDVVIQTHDLKKHYVMGSETVRALRGVDVAIERNEYIAIMGPSGSGKTTLLKMVAGAADPDEAAALDGLLLMDVGAAQRLLRMGSRLSRVDLVLDDGEEERVEALLPPGTRLVGAREQAGAAAQLTEAFRLNLTALSLLALVVGMFLIYNTVMFSVVEVRSCPPPPGGRARPPGGGGTGVGQDPTMPPSLRRIAKVQSRGTVMPSGRAGKLVLLGSPLPGCWVLQNRVRRSGVTARPVISSPLTPVSRRRSSRFTWP